MNEGQQSVRTTCMLGLAAMCWLVPTVGSASTAPASTNPTIGKSKVVATMMKAPLSFEANQGQTDNSVNFISRGSGYTLFLTPTESVMVLQQREAKEQGDDKTVSDPFSITEPALIKQSVVRMKLEGANPSPAIDGMEQLPGIVNYFIGNDPEKWRTKIPTYARVQYTEAYPGIDLAYYGNQGKLEYDFIVAPGADPNQIKLAFEGASAIKVAASGDLLLTTALGEVRLQKPVVYQLEKDGHKTLVAGNYIASPKAPNAVGIQLAAYDRTKPVIVDPVLLYSTYLGGSGNEAGVEFGHHGIAVDSTGNAHITGATDSLDFLGITGSSLQSVYGGGTSDVYVMKLNATGSSILWATYLGGIAYDRGSAIALDPSGNAYVTGYTNSTTTTGSTFPVTPGAFQTTGPANKAFVSKLSADGATLMYSTLLGASSSGGDRGHSIAVDAGGHAYVTGQTRGSTFPLTPGAFQTVHGGNTDDAFLTKLNPAGNGLIYSTFVGGNGNELGFSLAIDTSGNAYVSGWTSSTNFPGASSSPIGPTYKAGGFDGFAFKLNASGTALDWSTYLGGTADDLGRAIAVDSFGNAYATGQTASSDFPVTAGSLQTTIGSAGQYDAYVTKIDGGGQLVYSTYLGSTFYDGGFAIVVDSTGHAYVTGRGAGASFPGLVPLSGSTVPTTLGFLSKLNPAGSGVDYSVFIGAADATTEAFGIALDSAGVIYLTGWTRSMNLPLKDALKTTRGGTIDDFLMKIASKPLANAGPDQSVPEGTLVTLDGTGSSGGSLTYIWTQVAGPPAALGGATSAHPTFAAPPVPAAGGTATFELVVCEGTSSNCSDPDTVNVHITNVNHPPVAQAGPDQTVQEGSPVVLNGTGSYDPDVEPLTYQWLQLFGPPVTLLNATTATPSFTAPPVGAGGGQVDFELTVSDPRILFSSDYISVFITNINQVPVANAGPNQTVNENAVVTLNGTASSDPDLDMLQFTWTQTGGPLVALTGANTASPTFTAPPVGAGGATLTFQLVVSDGHAGSAPAQVTVNVQDVNDLPVCSAAKAKPKLLWPPNHKMVKVKIRGISHGTSRHDDDDNDDGEQQEGNNDHDGDDVQITITSVTQDEPVNGLGDGDTSPDAAISGNNILLRAERAGNGNGRVYEVHFTAAKGQGGSCSGTVKVSAPRNKKDTAVDSGQAYNSFGP